MKKYPLLLLGISLLLASCSTLQTKVNTSCPGYKNVEFSREMITKHGIGILPVLGVDEKLPNIYLRLMDDALTRHFVDAFGDTAMKSPYKLRYMLNDNNLSEEYTRDLGSYPATGIIPKDLVQRIGRELGVQYLLFSRLATDTIEQQVKAFGGRKEQVKVVEMYVQCQVWDCRTGVVVWEGKGGFARFDVDTTDLVEQTALSLANVIGTDRNTTPCLTKKDLVFFYESNRQQIPPFFYVLFVTIASMTMVLMNR